MGRKTIGDIVIQIKNIENQQASFKFDSTSLLLWIKEKTVQMQSRNFPSTLRGIQLEFKKFKEYRAVEKASKYNGKVEMEDIYFHIQMVLRQLGQSPYVPPEGEVDCLGNKFWNQCDPFVFRSETPGY